MPVAVSWILPPAGISHSLDGTILMYFSCGAWQVTPTDALMVPLVAVIVEEPFMVAPAVQVTSPMADTVATSRRWNSTGRVRKRLRGSGREVAGRA